jgi:macrodomain Ter protein organizer (MatP/YcbG family)
MKDTNNPSFKIRFFDAWEETNKTKKSIKVSNSVYGPIFEKSANLLKNWKDTIEVIIDNMDSNKKAPQTNSSSLSDELTKLNDLKEKGILTEEEFQQQKKKILE